MTDSEFDALTDKIQDLWPRLDWNDEIRNVWWMAVGQRQFDEVLPALRDWRANYRNMPHPSQIKSFVSSSKTDADCVDWGNEGREADASWVACDDAYSKMAPEAREAHKATEMRIKPKQWGDKDDRSWRALIAKRQELGLAPDGDISLIDCIQVTGEWSVPSKPREVVPGGDVAVDELPF
jgi:hypothetical protein